MTKQLQRIAYFFRSQYFADGLRITLSLLLPALLLKQFGQLPTGITISLGALFASIVDTPGPVVHRRNGMIYTVLFTFFVSLLTGFLRQNVYILGLEIALLSFFFSMFTLYGTRVTSLSSAVLLSMILVMDRPTELANVPVQSLLILSGGLWYTIISLLFLRLRPYRPAQQALGECLRELARFLAIKADFYRSETDLNEVYRRLVAQQVKVSEQQDVVRELLFKNRRMVVELTQTGRTLVLTFIDVVDLYEHVMAMYYDYAALRERFGQTGILTDISSLLRQASIEVDEIGLQIRSGLPYSRPIDFTPALDALNVKIDALGQHDKAVGNLTLKKILVNFRTLARRIQRIPTYGTQPETEGPLNLPALEYDRFVNHETINPTVFRHNLTFNSSVFRHSLRMAIACLVGFTVGRLLPHSHGAHSYWILLTITVILKPGFSLTKERNVQRLVGTIGGGLLGVLLLLVIQNTTVLFILLVVCMLVAYSFQRVDYRVMVFFLTPYILILFRFMGAGYLDIAEERVLDTFIGSVIAFLASYLLFPNWEFEQVTRYMAAMLRANRSYLQTLTEQLAGHPVLTVDYKLIRKTVYVSSANLSAAFQRMISEPRSKQRHRSEVHEFVVLNHILSANIATLVATLFATDQTHYSPELRQPLQQSLALLTESLNQLEPEQAELAPITLPDATLPSTPPDLTVDDRLLLEQLAFIQKTSTDLRQVTIAILAEPTPRSQRIRARWSAAERIRAAQ